MISDTTTKEAYDQAVKAFHLAPYYPVKLITKFRTPLVEQGDLMGLWFESLLAVCNKHPEKSKQTQLLLVMAHRHLNDELRKMHRLKRTGPESWHLIGKEDLIASWRINNEIINEENEDDIDDI